MITMKTKTKEYAMLNVVVRDNAVEAGLSEKSLEPETKIEEEKATEVVYVAHTETELCLLLEEAGVRLFSANFGIF